MTTPSIESARAPDLHIGGLKLWVDGRHQSELSDYWDGNWVEVRAEYRSANSRVAIAGPLLHLSEIVTLQRGCTRLAAQEVMEAGLFCREPNLKIELWAVPGGKFIGKVHITPDHKSEMHDFGFALGEGELDDLLAACGAILAHYPPHRSA